MADVKRFDKVKSSFLMLIVALWPGLAFSDSSIDSFLNPPSAGQSYSNEIQNALLAHYSNWAGTRHKLGGTGANGVDCSSFIQALFYDKFQLHLPRSSREQMTVGERVDVADLRSGDLLFFRTGPTRRHVGVYVGNNQFMHVSTRAGVEIARLFSPYWQRHFITARRVGLLGATPSN
ncbi:MAG: NlpC/P60 family protein [Burkholderiales bacterium]|jgi:lipoprotein Spr|uniref:NlpC/P60 family protein n=1 Tax=Limnobacter sp. TaxID=2003368 RepID=UPI00394239B9|nr:NlpC/P60 family protein [Burkholderiales bacterium]